MKFAVLMNIIIKLFSSILNSGIDKATSDEQKKGIVFLNAVCLFIMIMAFLILFVLTAFVLFSIEIPLQNNKWDILSLLWFAFFFNLLIIRLNKNGNFSQAKFLALLYPALLFFVQAYLYTDVRNVSSLPASFGLISRTRLFVMSLLLLIAIGKLGTPAFIFNILINLSILVFFEEIYSLFNVGIANHLKIIDTGYVSVRITYALFYLLMSVGIFRLHEVNFVYSGKLMNLNNELNQNNLMLESQKEEIIVQNEQLFFQKNELLNFYNKLCKQNQRINQSINYASRIQQALLPDLYNLNTKRLTAAVFFAPRDVVSGDFYWTYRKNKSFFFCTADCTGHGVPGAFMSILSIQLLNQIIRENGIYKPSDILESLNELLEQALNLKNKTINDGLELSICHIDFKKGSIEFAGAGQTIVIVNNQEALRYKGNIMPIGNNVKELYHRSTFEQYVLPLSELKNGRVYLFSDGFQDQFGESSRKFSSKRFNELLLQSSMLELHEQIDFIKRKFYNWKGNAAQIDDVTVLAIQLNNI